MLSGLEQKLVDEIVEQSVLSGVNFFDVAPTYGDAEVKLGNALYGIRNKILLSCKTTRRDRDGAMLELKQSMKNLRTDYFDFYVMHGISDIEKDVRVALSDNGMLVTAIEARKQGIVRRIGFSAHSEEAAIFALNSWDFDFLMFPVNIFSFQKSGFGKRIIEIASEKNVDLIGIKVLAFQRWHTKTEKTKYPNCWYQPVEDREIARAALAWALKQNIVSAIPPADIRIFKMALELADNSLISSKHDLEKIRLLIEKIVPVFP